MPAIYEDASIKKFTGMVCDVCGEEDLNGCSDFVLKHQFGYGSEIDGDQVEAAICDECLERIIKDNIKGAVWSGSRYGS